MLEIFDNVTSANDDIDIGYITPDIVAYFSDNVNINTINLNKHLDDNDDEHNNDLKTMIHARLAPWCNQ